ncbi:ABC transporter substrate-binding protein, partial [Bacillus sp. S34]|nr:ABC transporter substrate-binding protein [Bacillus sp. S34]
YPNLEFDEEAVLAAAPDLIVVSASGADSTVDEYDALSKIAPTIVLDYGDESWQDLATALGTATGHESPGGPHAELLDPLGFTMRGADDDLDTSEQSRNDFAFLSIEDVTTALTGSTVFVISGGDSTTEDLESTSVLRTAPALESGNIVALGPDSFRIGLNTPFTSDSRSFHSSASPYASRNACCRFSMCQRRDSSVDGTTGYDALGVLDRVPEGVSVVEDLASALLGEVVGDHLRLELDRDEQEEHRERGHEHRRQGDAEQHHESADRLVPPHVLAEDQHAEHH